jgi:hypothetical protein
MREPWDDAQLTAVLRAVRASVLRA